MKASTLVTPPECSRVLHFTAGMDRAGAETLLMNIYRRLDRTQLQFDFLVWDGPGYDFEAEITEMGGRVFRAPNAGKHLGGFVNRVWRILRSNRFAAVHAHVHYWNGIFLPLARAAGVSLRLAHSHTPATTDRLLLVLREEPSII